MLPLRNVPTNGIPYIEGKAIGISILRAFVGQFKENHPVVGRKFYWFDSLEGPDTVYTL